MYLFSQSNARDLLRGGLSEPRDTSDHARSLEDILKALQLNPVRGYEKGSAARKKLEDALKSVPLTSALEVFNQLKNGTGHLGKLFQYRLHDATKPVVLNILWLKHLEQQKQLKDAQDILKKVCEEQKQMIEKHRVALQNIQDSVENICKTTGEDSDTCQQARFNLMSGRIHLDDLIRSHGTHCR